MIAGDLMTKEVMTVSPNDSIIKVAQIMFEHNWDGLPVVSPDNTLLGLITQFDLVTKGANIHLPTFIQLMSQMHIYKTDASALKPELSAIVTMTVKDVMNVAPLTIHEGTTLEEVGKAFAEHHRVNPIPVVDGETRLVGIISRFDLIKLYTGSMATADAITSENSIDKKVDIFVKGFNKNALIVSKYRPLFWKLMSIFFIVVGFIVAMALIIKIEVRY